MNNPNLTPDEILKMAAAMKNSDSNTQTENLVQTLLGRLSPESRAKLSGILKDKSAMENILSSEQARELMKKFRK